MLSRDPKCANAAPFGAELLQLMLGQETSQATDDRLRPGIRLGQVVVPEAGCARRTFVRAGGAGQLAVGQVAIAACANDRNPRATARL